MEKSQKSPNPYYCDKCDYTGSRPSELTRHLSTAKHKRLMNPNAANKKTPSSLVCKCGKIYLHMSSLCKHKKTCSVITMNHYKPEEVTSNNKDVMIEKLVEELTSERAEKKEMKSMFMMMIEKCQEMQMQNNELVNKVIDVIPKMGNTTNTNSHNTTNNNTLNFYLTNTCKDAESIHDFADRYVKQCTDFFVENYRSIASNQMCLASNVYNIMFKCLEKNPQYMNFIQTTDVKNGIHYVKEKKKDENRQLCGDGTVQWLQKL